jgi:hypothetical protein
VNGIKALGSAVSGFKKIWDGVFGNKEIMKVNDMRDAFFQAQGGWLAFSQRMAAVSDEDWAKKIFDAKSVEEFNELVRQAMALLNQANSIPPPHGPITPGDVSDPGNAHIPPSGVNPDWAIPQYALGTPWVPRDQLAYVHRAEAIIPAKDNPYARSSSSSYGASQGAPSTVLVQVVLERKVLAEQLVQINQDDSGVRESIKRAVAGRY